MMESLMMGYIIDFSDILGVSMMLFFLTWVIIDPLPKAAKL